MAVSNGVKSTPQIVEAMKERKPPTAIVGASPAYIQHQRLTSMQDDLLERSLMVVDASMAFAEIDPESKKPPKKWVEDMGEQEALIRWRIARAGWMSAKDAPVGIKVASAVAVGIIKAKATEKAGPKQLNIALVQLSSPLPQFPEQDVEER